jgi:hypothetical protein
MNIPYRWLAPHMTKSIRRRVTLFTVEIAPGDGSYDFSELEQGIAWRDAARN